MTSRTEEFEVVSINQKLTIMKKVVLFMLMIVSAFAAAQSSIPDNTTGSLPRCYGSGNVGFIIMFNSGLNTPLQFGDTIFAFGEIEGKNVILSKPCAWKKDTLAVPFAYNLNETDPSAPELSTGAKFGTPVKIGVIKNGTKRKLTPASIKGAGSVKNGEMLAAPLSVFEVTLGNNSVGNEIGELFMCPFLEWETVQMPIQGDEQLIMNNAPAVNQKVYFRSFSPKYLYNEKWTLQAIDSRLEEKAFGPGRAVYERSVIMGLKDLQAGSVTLTVTGVDYLNNSHTFTHIISYPPVQTMLIPDLTIQMFRLAIDRITYSVVPGGLRLQYNDKWLNGIFPEVKLVVSGVKTWNVSSPGFPNVPVIFTKTITDGKLDVTIALPLDGKTWSNLYFDFLPLYLKDNYRVDLRKSIFYVTPPIKVIKPIVFNNNPIPEGATENKYIAVVQVGQSITIYNKTDKSVGFSLKETVTVTSGTMWGTNVKANSEITKSVVFNPTKYNKLKDKSLFVEFFVSPPSDYPDDKGILEFIVK